MKKIWLFCLCLASLTLVWCFHVPDEDWLPSRNKVKTDEVKNDEEVEQAINSLMNWLNMISSGLDETKNDENGEVNDEESEDITGTGDESIDIEETIDNEVTNSEEIINTGSENQEIENTIE